MKQPNRLYAVLLCSAFVAVAGCKKDDTASSAPQAAPAVVLSPEEAANVEVIAALNKAKADSNEKAKARGTKRGTITSISLEVSSQYNKGALRDICVSGEGEMRLEDSKETFRFSVPKNDILLFNKLQDAATNGHTLMMTYKQVFEHNRCTSGSNTHAMDVEDITARQEKEEAKREAAARAAQDARDADKRKKDAAATRKATLDALRQHKREQGVAP